MGRSAVYWHCQQGKPQSRSWRPTDLFISLFYPLLFCEWRKTPRTRSPASRGVFLSVWRKMCSDRRASSVNNFSKTVQKRFTHRRGKCGILNMSKGSSPLLPIDRQVWFFFLFLFPSFFEQRKRSADPASPCRVRSVFVCPEGRFSAETNLSNSVQKLFTHCGAECGILTLSAREAAIPNR